MSVTIRPYINGGWEADIRVALPDGTVIRERKKAAGEDCRAVAVIAVFASESAGG